MPGGLLIKGAGVFTGCYKATEENRKAFDKHVSSRTGDLAMMDDAGNFTITCRIREMINRGWVKHCKNKLAGYKCPKKIEFWGELPKTPVGEILRKDVKKHFWKGREKQIS